MKHTTLVLVGALLSGCYFLPSITRVDAPKETRADAAFVAGKTVDGYAGRLLAGSADRSPYLAFAKADYDRAMEEGKLIILNVVADDCAICLAEEPELIAGFEKLQNPNVVAFRVNIRASDGERAIAKTLQAATLPTKSVVRNNQELLRHVEAWDREELLRAIVQTQGE